MFIDGAYAYEGDAASLFRSVISLVLNEGYPIRQAFHRARSDRIRPRATVNILSSENEHQFDGVGDLEFNHSLSD